MDPNQSEFYINRGLAKRLLSDFEGAIKDADHSIKLTPNSPLAFFH
jgi:hypothetical protein